MKGTVGRTTRHSSDNSKRPEDEKNKNKVVEESEAEDDEEEVVDGVQRVDTLRPTPKHVNFDLPAPGMAPKFIKPKMVPYVNVPPLRVPLKVKPAVRAEPIPIIEKRPPSYKLKAPIEEEVKEEELIKKLKEQKLEVTQGQLLGMATPAFRRRFVEEIIPRRVPSDSEPAKLMALQIDETEEIDALVEELGQESEYMHMDDLPPATFVQYTQRCGNVPAGAIVLEDP